MFNKKNGGGYSRPLDCLVTCNLCSLLKGPAYILVKRCLYRVVFGQTQIKEKTGGPTPNQTGGQAEGNSTPGIGHRGRAKH